MTLPALQMQMAEARCFQQQTICTAAAHIRALWTPNQLVKQHLWCPSSKGEQGGQRSMRKRAQARQFFRGLVHVRLNSLVHAWLA